MGYKEGELQQLHTHLYDILSHIDAACARLGIRYFIIAGTAIGAHFEGDILPWDDDIDIGMERADYDRFLIEAQGYLGDNYFVQSYLSELSTPYYFTKVRKVGTRFEGDDEVGLNIHHGIFIDIFPMDRVPSNRGRERRQRYVVAQLINAFVATTIPLRNGGRLQRALVTAFARMVGKRRLFEWLTQWQTRYNDEDSEYINIIRMPRDHIARASVNPPERIRLGSMQVWAPHDLPRYLNSHYPNLRRHIPPEEQINHAPLSLNFNGEE